jgi:hypothetical protein
MKLEFKNLNSIRLISKFEFNQIKIQFKLYAMSFNIFIQMELNFDRFCFFHIICFTDSVKKLIAQVSNN